MKVVVLEGTGEAEDGQKEECVRRQVVKVKSSEERQGCGMNLGKNYVPICLCDKHPAWS